MVKKYGSFQNYINEVFIIPAIALGVDYKYIMELTPFSLMTIVKGLEKKREIENQQQDTNNYLLAIYILSGLSGKMPDKPYSMIFGGKENVEEKQENDLENNYNAKKGKFAFIMNKVNSKFNRKEG